MDITKELFKMQDLNYRDFHSKLMPGIDKETIIGVKIPDLRKFAKEYSKNEESKEFLKKLPHKYYEENNLHAFVIEKIADFEEALYQTEIFLPYIDNWATCDMFMPKVFLKNKDKILKKIQEWIKSDEPYIVRYAIGLLMKLFLDEDFNEKYLKLVSGVESDHYYVKMMVAWYFATALSKQYDLSVRYIEEKRLDKWTHNKTIQKAVESKRISKATKEYLKTLKYKC